METRIAPAPSITSYAWDIASLIPYTVKHFCDFNTFCYWGIASYASEIPSFAVHTEKQFHNFNAFCYFIYILSVCVVFALILCSNCEWGPLDFSLGDLSSITSNSDLDSEYSDPSSDIDESMADNANQM